MLSAEFEMEKVQKVVGTSGDADPSSPRKPRQKKTSHPVRSKYGAYCMSVRHILRLCVCVASPRYDTVTTNILCGGCLTCRSKKVKCDEGLPSCRRCKRLNLECQQPCSSAFSCLKQQRRGIGPWKARHQTGWSPSALAPAPESATAYQEVLERDPSASTHHEQSCAGGDDGGDDTMRPVELGNQDTRNVVGLASQKNSENCPWYRGDQATAVQVVHFLEADEQLALDTEWLYPSPNIFDNSIS